MMILKRTGPTSRGGATREGQGKPPRTGRTGPKRLLMCCIVVIPKCSDSSYVICRLQYPSLRLSTPAPREPPQAARSHVFV